MSSNTLRYVGTNKYRPANIERITYENPGFIIREHKVGNELDDYIELVPTADHGAVALDGDGNALPESNPTPFSVGSIRCRCGALIYAKDNMMELDMAFSTHVAYPDVPLKPKPRVAHLSDDGPQHESTNWLSVNVLLKKESETHVPE